MIKLNSSYVAIMLRVVPKQDVRVFLENILITAANNRIIAYATDGHQMVRWIVQEDYEGDNFRYLVPGKHLTTALKLKTDILFDTTNGSINIDFCGTNIVLGPNLEDIYPDIESVAKSYAVASSGVMDDTFLIDANYLANIAAAAKILAKEKKVKSVGVRSYSRQGESSIVNTFVFSGFSNLVYFVAGLKQNGPTDHEHYAALLDDHDVSKDVIRERLLKGHTSIPCYVSNVSHDDIDLMNRSTANTAKICFYDGLRYIDNYNQSWKFATMCTPISLGSEDEYL